MKKILLFLGLFVSLSSFGQIKFRALSSVGGATLDRGGTFEYVLQANGNSNNTTRQVLVDMQYDQTNFELVSVNHTGTGGNGGGGSGGVDAAGTPGTANRGGGGGGADAISGGSGSGGNGGSGIVIIAYPT